MTAYNENVELIVDNFEYTSQKSNTAAFSHSITFNNSNKAIHRGDQVKPSTVFSGASISKNKGKLALVGGSSYTQYTNYEKMKITSTPSNLSTQSQIDSFLIQLSDLKNNESKTVSYDLFETIDPSYNQSEVEFGMSFGSTQISILLLKAPSSLKLNNPTMFNESIVDSDSFWNYRGGQLSNLCTTSRIQESERIVSFRIKKNGTIVNRLGKVVKDYTKSADSYIFRSIASGNIKPLSLNAIGSDGRYADYSIVRPYIAKANLGYSIPASEIVDNTSYYPDRSKCTVINTSSINSYNKLSVSFDVKFDVARKVATLKIKMFDSKGTISLYSDTINVPFTSISSVSVFQRISSKNAEPEYLLNKMVYSTEDIQTITDPHIDGKYEQPIIALEVNDVAVEISDSIDLYASDVLKIYSYSPYTGLDSQIKSSYNEGSYSLVNFVEVTGTALFKTHLFRSFVEASTGILASDVSELSIHINAKLPTPTIVFTLNSNRLPEVTITSGYDIFYSTDGTEPDLINHTNCALYTEPFVISRDLIIKAVAVYSDSISDMASLHVDPQILPMLTCNTPTIAVGGVKDANLKYTSTVNVNLSVVPNTANPAFDGQVDIRYTLDGSNPADEMNHEAKTYIGSFDVRPLGGRSITIKAIATNPTMKNSPIASMDLDFAYECNAWRIDNTYPNITAAALTSEGSLKIFNGTELIRVNKFQTNVELEFKLVDVYGAMKLLFGYHSYLRSYNNYKNQNGYESSRNKIPTISIYDVYNKVATLSLGYKVDKANDDNFNAFGSFDFNVDSQPTIKLSLKNDIITPDNSHYIDAVLDMKTAIVNNSSIELDRMKGYYNEDNLNCIVYNIPSDEQRVLKLNDSAQTGTSLEITRRGIARNSILHISFNNESVKLDSDKAIVFVKTIDSWSYTYVDSYLRYNGSAKIKVEVGGLSTDYIEVSDNVSDNLMMIATSVNNDPADYITIGNISGNCI